MEEKVRDILEDEILTTEDDDIPLDDLLQLKVRYPDEDLYLYIPSSYEVSKRLNLENNDDVPGELWVVHYREQTSEERVRQKDIELARKALDTLKEHPGALEDLLKDYQP